MQHHQYAQQNHAQTTSQILSSLLAGPQTATALREAVFRAEGQMIEPGAFSRLLARMEQCGWMVSVEGEQRLCLYHITDSGRFVLQQARIDQHTNQEYQDQHAGWHGGKERLMRLVLWLLRLYPIAWRERYEMEMVALLEQHHITLWTVLDLLIGALDARLDPHYRQTRPLLPLRRFQSSWRLVIGAFIVFWLALLPWFWLHALGISDTQCSNWSNFSYCMFRTSLGLYGPAFSQSLIGMILILLPILLVFFTFILIQARKRRARMQLLLAFLVTFVMLVINIACGLWYLALWQILPQINHFAALTPVGLQLGLIGMALSTVLSLAALLRATFALRALFAASPRQEFFPVLAPGQEERQVEQPDNLLESQTESGANTAHPEPSIKSSISTQGEKSSWLLRGVLAMLLLLFLLPWPFFVIPDVSFLDLLRQLFLASIVGGVTAPLVMVHGKRLSEPVTGKQHASISLSFWLTGFFLALFLFAIIGFLHPGWILLFIASFVSIITTLLVIVFNKRSKKATTAIRPSARITIFWFVGLLLLSLMNTPLHVLLVLVLLMLACFHFVIVEALRPLRDWLALAVTAILAFFMGMAVLFPQLERNFSSFPGFVNLDSWAILIFLACLCILPALVVRAQARNSQSEHSPHRRSHLSSQAWIIILPVWFLTVCMELEYLFSPDYNSFAEVFVTWLITGLAG
jgi:DNA-binding PadR family transcriptional regulator